MHVLGTAGHVDHGKSALIFALTGIDPDRLPEEKKREMTIDLGFAWLKLPSGREISIVDVPGHRRFIKNMLAGIGGINMVLLVVAADEGVMPQTREHLAILDLLGLRYGVIAITKKDLADEEMQELISMDIVKVVKGTALDGAPIVTTSSVTGEGLSGLQVTIDKLLDSVPPPRDIGRPRLSIDRIFTMKGFGTVVAGTLLDGGLSAGQEVEILPIGHRTCIRSLQTHRQKVDVAQPGSRVAANIVGIAVKELERGFVLTTAGWLKPTRLVDIKLRAASSLTKPIDHNAIVTFHTGAGEEAGKLRLLDRERLNPGESGWGQVRLEQPIAMAKGDLYILRSHEGTIGGGEIVDPYAKRHRRFSSMVIENLAARGNNSSIDSLLAILKANEPAEFGHMLNISNLPSKTVQQVLDHLISEKRVVKLGSDIPRALFFSLDGWNGLVDAVKRLAQQYHCQFPLRRGMPKEEIRSKLRISPLHFDIILKKLIDEGIITRERTLLRLTSHKIKLSDKQLVDAKAFLSSLSRNPYSPSRENLPDPEIFNMLINERLVIKLSNDIVFLTSAYDEMVEYIVEYLKLKQKITVAEVRDMFKTSRRYALALLEYLDEQKITRRVSDVHMLHPTVNLCRRDNATGDEGRLDFDSTSVSRSAGTIRV